MRESIATALNEGTNTSNESFQHKVVPHGDGDRERRSDLEFAVHNCNGRGRKFRLPSVGAYTKESEVPRTSYILASSGRWSSTANRTHSAPSTA